MTATALHYLGTDPATDWIPGVPARDLTAEEAERFPAAAESALYVPAKRSARGAANATPETDPA